MKLHGPMRSKERERRKGGRVGGGNPNQPMKIHIWSSLVFLGRPRKKLDNPLGNLAK